MTDLFSAAGLDPSRVKYPDRPGYSNPTTSKAAAKAIEPSAKTLRNIALHWIAVAGDRGLTTNELADQMGVDRDSVQPRTSELKAAGKIIDSGQRRANANGKRAIVWKVKP